MAVGKVKRTPAKPTVTPKAIGGKDNDFVLVWKPYDGRGRVHCALNSDETIKLFSTDEEKKQLLVLKSMIIALTADQLDETLTEASGNMAIVTTLGAIHDTLGW